MQTAENLHKAVTNTQSRVDYVAIGLQDEFNRQLQEMEKNIAERYKNKQAEEQAKMLQAELDLQKQQNEAQERMLQNMAMMQNK